MSKRSQPASPPELPTTPPTPALVGRNYHRPKKDTGKKAVKEGRTPAGLERGGSSSPLAKVEPREGAPFTGKLTRYQRWLAFWDVDKIPNNAPWVRSYFVSQRTLLMIRSVMLMYMSVIYFVHSLTDPEKLIAYLTNIAYMAGLLYLALSVIFTLADYRRAPDDLMPSKRKWYHTATWLLFTVVWTEGSFVALSYWAVLSAEVTSVLDPVYTYHSHGVNVAIIFIELMLNRLHFPYSHIILIIGANVAYFVFAALYNVLSNGDTIYGPVAFPELLKTLALYAYLLSIPIILFLVGKMLVWVRDQRLAAQLISKRRREAKKAGKLKSGKGLANVHNVSSPITPHSAPPEEPLFLEK